MADIIRLLGSPHERTQALLSWHATGTLDEEDRALVGAHLPECAECRADLAFERALAAEMASLPIDQEHGWNALAAKLDSAPQRPAPVAFLRSRVSVGWMIAGQLAGLAAMLLVIVNVTTPTAPLSQEYQALGAAPATQAGNIVVIFHPQTNERDLREALLKTGSRLVDGPNASGAYVLHVTPAKRDNTVEALRAMPQIHLAEPVDAVSRR
jgi:anti-sigma factor RsiW